MPPSLKISILALVCAVIYMVGVFLPASGEGEAKALRLIDGDPLVAIEHLEIEYQQRRVICDDSQMLNEFADAFRNATRTPIPGTSYLMTLRFRQGGEFSTALYVRNGELSVSVPRGPESAPTHKLAFSKDRSPNMGRLIDFLEQPYQAVANNRLLFRSGESPKLERIAR